MRRILECCATCDYETSELDELTHLRALVITKTGDTIAADIEVCDECFEIVDGEPFPYSDYPLPTRELRVHT